MKYLSGLKEIIDQFDVFLLDQWGVMHNGVEALPYACSAVSSLKKNNKKLIILSNSGRRAKVTQNIIARMGFQSIDYILTSGEYLHLCLSKKNKITDNLGKNVFFLGYDGHQEILKETNLSLVDDLQLADFVLCTGLPDNKVLEDYCLFLENILMRKIPFFCVNPDRFSLDAQGVLRLCPGSLADMYEKMGGVVYWSGKPYPEIYQKCIEWADVALNRIIGVGDSLHHDIKGANNIGIASCWITTGVHVYDVQGGKDYKICEEFCKNENIIPTYVIDCLRF